MSGIQKIIKYCAIALALSLIFGIFISIMRVFTFFSTEPTFNVNDTNTKDSNLITTNIKNNYNEIEIDIKTANLIIEEGTEFKIETDNKNINIKQKREELKITERKHNWLTDDESKLIIYLPIDTIFEEVTIETGAGTVDIKDLYTKDLTLDLGAGKVMVDNLNALNETEIDGGAGEIKINNSIINNLDLDMGVGKLTLTSKLTGNNEINSGVGEVNLSLTDAADNYKIKVEKGIGNIKINGDKVNNDTYYGIGSNLIEINGGIGNININFKS